MHVWLLKVNIEPSQLETARKALREQVVPMVSTARGFVAGYWLEPVDGRGSSIVVFDTEQHARETAPQVGDSPVPGVTVVSVEFREVVESA